MEEHIDLSPGIIIRGTGYLCEFKDNSFYSAMHRASDLCSVLSKQYQFPSSECSQADFMFNLFPETWLFNVLQILL